jgi:ethanolamine utilization protein EutA (predicted chaperonin)
VSVIDDGRIRAPSALNIGARLLAYDDGEVVTRLEKPGDVFLPTWIRSQHREQVEEDLRRRLAARMAHVLFDAVSGGKPPWDDLYVTAPFGDLPRLTVSCSRGCFRVHLRP